MRRLLVLSLLAAVALPASAAAAAPTVEVVATGLDNPRHLDVGPFGEVYVAESGRGGEGPPCFDAEDGRACVGSTGAVTRIGRHGGQQRVITGLASSAGPSGEAATGPHGLDVAGLTLLVTVGGPTAPTRGGVPLTRDQLASEGAIAGQLGRVLAFRPWGRGHALADVYAHERDANPDGQPVDSNAVAVLADRGRLYVADAGGDWVGRIGWRGGIDTVAVFPTRDVPGPAPDSIVPMDAVPTGLAPAPSGDLYVSQLTGFPFPVGGANLYRVDPRTGETEVAYGGFTNLIDVAKGRHGELYVLSIDADGLLGPGEAGALWVVEPDGTRREVELPAGTLVAPGGIAVGRRGTLYVSNKAVAPGGGEVLKISLSD